MDTNCDSREAVLQRIRRLKNFAQFKNMYLSASSGLFGIAVVELLNDEIKYRYENEAFVEIRRELKTGTPNWAKMEELCFTIPEVAVFFEEIVNA